MKEREEMEEIRLYSREELNGMDKEKVIELFLENQEWVQKFLTKYTATTNLLSVVCEENRLLKVKLFGRSSEKTSSIVPENGKEEENSKENKETDKEENKETDKKENKEDQQLPDDQKEEEEKKKASDPPAGNEGEEKKKPGRPKRGKGCMEKQKENLPVVEIHEELGEEKLKELLGDGKISELPFYTYDVIRMRPASSFVERHYVHVYKKGNKIVKADKPQKLLARSDISSDTLAYALNGRFSLNLPANRICQEMKRNGYAFTRQRMYSLTERFAFDTFELIVERMKQIMFATGYIQADETGVKVLEKIVKEGKKSDNNKIWTFLTSERNDVSSPQIALFFYTHSRAGKHLREFIEGFSGIITSDAYSAYISVDNDKTNKVRISGCMGHNRRKYADVLKAMPGFKKLSKKEKAEVPAFKALKLIGKIYSAENKLTNLTPEERYAKRQTEVKPLVDDFFAYIHGLNVDEFDKGGLMYKAINYSKNQEKYLRVFLTDGHIPIDNSASERAILSSIALGRNVWKTIATVDGAVAATYAYSLAETAKRNGARPYFYFKYVLEKGCPLIQAHVNDPITELEYLDPIMPWSEEYREYERTELLRDREILNQIANSITKEKANKNTAVAVS